MAVLHLSGIMRRGGRSSNSWRGLGGSNRARWERRVWLRQTPGTRVGRLQWHSRIRAGGRVAGPVVVAGAKRPLTRRPRRRRASGRATGVRRRAQVVRPRATARAHQRVRWRANGMDNSGQGARIE